MKKYIKISIIVSFVLLLASCTSLEMNEYFEDYASENSSALKFDNIQTPSWLEGGWYSADGSNYYKFTGDDIKSTSNGITKSFYEIMSNCIFSSEYNSETLTLSAYDINNTDVEFKWIYTKISDTEVNYKIYTDGTLISSENLTAAK
jgi:hypothetical protein